MDLSPFDLRSRSLFKRCVQCKPLSSVSCPPCSTDEVCTLIPLTCDRCPEYQCVETAESGAVAQPAPAGPSTSIAGPVVGGVCGAILLLSIATYFFWKYAVKDKKEQPEEWDPMDYPMEKPGTIVGDDGFSRDARSRASTHTVTSMASTVLTRASNVIQIAFIPGVTTRQANSPDASPVPPVPPIPSASNSFHHNSASHEDQMLFLPGDLRGSTYSDMSAFDDPSRHSIAPSLMRQSIASTVFKEQAVVVNKAKPAMVSVSKHGSAQSTPAVPSVDMSKYVTGDSSASSSKPILVQIPSSSEGASRSSPSSSGGQSLKPKAVMITTKKATSPDGSVASTPSPSTRGSVTAEKKFSSPLAISARAQSMADSTFSAESPHARAKRFSGPDSDSEDEGDTHQRSRQSIMKQKIASASKDISPFSDAAAVEKKKIKDERTKGTESPFDDRNEV